MDLREEAAVGDRYHVGLFAKFESEHNKAVFTLKQSYLPWRLRVKESAWVIQPLSCSLFLSSVLSDKFWTHEPDRYPKGYYGFSTRIRANLSLGQRVMYDVRMYLIGGYRTFLCIMN